MSTQTPFTVLARLQQGAALDARFGVALDGLLAAQVRHCARRDVATDGLPVPGSALDGGQHLPDPVEVPLPLARCHHAWQQRSDPSDPTGDPWHWMATTAEPVDHQDRPIAVSQAVDLDVHHVNGRYSHRTGEVAAARLPKVIAPNYGRYRARRLPVVTIPAAGLRWRGVGDVAAVRALLAPLSTVGARRGAGEGTVLSWTVTADNPGDVFGHGHTHAGGSLGRPCPVECALRAGAGADDLTVGVAGLRPPYWHSHRQARLALPDYHRGGTRAAP